METISMNTDPVPRPRLTRQRQLVADHLDGSDEFLTAQQVHAALRADGESIGLATVYRNLTWLAEADMLDAIRNPEGEMAYRRCSPAHHHHLICRRCGRAVEVAGDILEQWSQRVAAEHGFIEPEHFVEIYGICSECA
jgi:Fur family ferric uptake transcriptional regulator